VQGSVDRERLRRSLNLTSWQAGRDLVRAWEASGEIGVRRVEIPSLNDAIERFFEDIAARGLSDATVGKQDVLLRKQFAPWCRGRGEDQSSNHFNLVRAHLILWRLPGRSR